MKPRRPRKKSAKKRILKVGDRVTVDMGGSKVRAVIIEDRGALGVGGRQIVRLRLISSSPGVEGEYELPAESLEHA